MRKRVFCKSEKERNRSRQAKRGTKDVTELEGSISGKQQKKREKS